SRVPVTAGQDRMSDETRRLFLGIARSACGVAWQHRLSPQQENVALAIGQSHGISDLVARIIASRGVSAEEAPRFLAPPVRDLLPDPLTLTDMDRAGERIAAAILRRENVAIFGDYDV